MPYEQIVAGARLVEILGPLSLEILVLVGDARDKDIFARIARSVPLSPAMLSALGRADLVASAWRAAIIASKPDPRTRLRRGKPWSPAVVADELERGT